MGLHGCALSVTRLPCLLIPRASPWCLSLCWANLGPAPLPFTVFCPPALSRAGREGAQGPRHSHAEVHSPERPVPSWLPCLYGPPTWGGGGGGSEGATAVPDVPGWYRCPTFEPAGPSTRVSPSELRGRTAAATELGLRRLQATAAAETARSPDTLLS